MIWRQGIQLTAGGCCSSDLEKALGLCCIGFALDSFALKILFSLKRPILKLSILSHNLSVKIPHL